MPQETLGGADRAKRIRQKIEAGTALPPGASASDSTDSRVGRIWRLEDGCCADPYKLSLITAGQSYDRATTGITICDLYLWQLPIPAGQNVTVTNLTGSSVTYYIGGTPGIPISLLSYTSSISAGHTFTIPSQYSDGQASFYFNNGNNTPCMNS